MTTKTLSLIVFVLVCTGSFNAQQKRPITVVDCVRTQRIIDNEVRLSPNGLQVAYLVLSPDVEKNLNRYQLYLRDLSAIERRDNGRLLFEAQFVSGIKWLDSHHITFRATVQQANEPSPHNEIGVIDIETNTRDKLEIPQNTLDFSSNADGSILVYSVRPSRSNSDTRPANAEQSPDRDLRGYRIIFGQGSSTAPRFDDGIELYLVKRTATGIETRQLDFHGPTAGRDSKQLRAVSNLCLSPDGRYLVFAHNVDILPASWEDEPLSKQLREMDSGGYARILSIYDIGSGELRLAFNRTYILGGVTWSQDSKSFSVIAPFPYGTPEGRKESAAAAADGSPFFYLYRFNHVFAVDAETREAQLVLYRDTEENGNPKFKDDVPLAWKNHHGEMTLRADEGAIVQLRFENGNWKEVSRYETPARLAGSISSLVSNGRVVAGIAQGNMIPPDLFELDLQTKQYTILTDLNPEYRNVQLGQVEPLEWSNRFGSKTSGRLIKPVGYEPGRKYPLVFLGVYTGQKFISDAYPGTTAFPPQLLANAGFVVIMAHLPSDNKIPINTYPGNVREKVNWMAMVESAVDLLVNRGMIDRGNVSIAGFSRSAALANYTLTHSKYQFVAASTADSVLFAYSDYFQGNFLHAIRSGESEMGGAPYGATLQNWLAYSVPFNAANVRAAILMEFSPPISDAYEFFTALNRLGKPVEMYLYPKGKHPLDTPFERVASLQRNIDWYRFWMQGYERPNPEDSDQYLRWRKLREQQQWNERMRAQGKDPTIEFLRQTAPGAILGTVEPAPAARDFIR